MAQKNLRLYLPVKRANAVGPFGIGSIVTIRNGVSGVVCGIPRWEEAAAAFTFYKSANQSSAAQAIEGKLISNSFSNPRIEKLLNIDLLVQPPTVEDINDSYYPWLIPVARFPLIEYCTNNKCKKVHTRHPNEYNKNKCDMQECTGKYFTKQVPIFLICPKGHLEDLDLVRIAHLDNQSVSCTISDVVYEAKDDIKNPNIRCQKCNSKSKVRDWLNGAISEGIEGEAKANKIVIKCGGFMPWINGTYREKCAEEMHIQVQNSTQVYFPKTFSSLFIPQTNGVSDTLLDWIGEECKNPSIASSVQGGNGNVIFAQCKKYFPEVSLTELDEHIKVYNNPRQFAGENNLEIATSHEIEEVLSLRSKETASDKYAIISPLEKEEISLDRIDAQFHGIVKKIVAVHRVSEDKVFLGFTRSNPPKYGDYIPNIKQINPPSLTKLNNSNLNWLPATRSYGEGIYIELNQNLFKDRDTGNISEEIKPEIAGKPVSDRFLFAHTLAHALILEASLLSGYSTTNITEKIYDVGLSSGEQITAIFIYTSSATDSGTLGGLVELASSRDEMLSKIIGNSLEKVSWCSLDPVCINNKGACHHCVLLPETSCQYQNDGLNRKLIIR
jgi:hypothetical protein